MIRRIFQLGGVGLTLLGLVSAPAHALQAYPHTEETAEVDALFAEWDTNATPGAAIGIIKDGRIIYARGYGMANLEYDIPNTPQTVFRIGSTSKHFTAMAIALLVEQGKLALDDYVRKYLPELPAYDAPVTIRNMIHHTSGLRNYEHLTVLAGIDSPLHPSPFYTDEEAVAMIARQKALNFTPGEQYEYSNSNYFLLAEVIGRASGMETVDFAKKHMFDPLGMTNTHFHNDVDRIVRNRASGYSPAEGGGYRINMTRLGQIGTGSIFTTIEDFFKWDQNFYDNKLGGGHSLIELVETPGATNSGESVEYGFGLNVEIYGGLKLISHGGAFAGFRSYYMRFPDQRFSVVLLANQGPFPLEELPFAIANIYLEDEFTEPVPVARDFVSEEAEAPKRVRLSQKARKQYVGVFHSAELDANYVINVSDGKLMVRVGRYFTDELVPIGADRFIWALGESEFLRNEEGDITGFILHSEPIRNIGFKKMHDR